MKRIIVLFVIGVVFFAACSGSGGKGGTFTLTGIPPDYEGKYVILELEDDDWGGGWKSIDFSEQLVTITAVRIANGKVSVPLWVFEEGNGEIPKTKRYTGNHSLEVIVFITNNEKNQGMAPIKQREFRKVEFVDGSATKSWDAGR